MRPLHFQVESANDKCEMENLVWVSVLAFLASWRLVSRDWAVYFFPVSKLNLNFSFGVRQIKVSHRLGNGQKLMHVVCAGKHLARNFPGAAARFGKQPDDFRLPLPDCAKIAIEQLL